eukprot:361266_1
MEESITTVQRIQKVMKSSNKHDHRLEKQITRLKHLTHGVLQQKLTKQTPGIPLSEITTELTTLDDIAYSLQQSIEFEEMTEDQTDLLLLLYQQINTENNEIIDQVDTQWKSKVNQLTDEIQEAHQEIVSLQNEIVSETDNSDDKHVQNEILEIMDIKQFF